MELQFLYAIRDKLLTICESLRLLRRDLWTNFPIFILQNIHLPAEDTMMFNLLSNHSLMVKSQIYFWLQSLYFC